MISVLIFKVVLSIAVMKIMSSRVLWVSVQSNEDNVMFAPKLLSVKYMSDFTLQTGVSVNGDKQADLC